jgi:hypothetical protein
VVDFDAIKHQYRLAGRLLPSVTQVLQAITNFDRVPWDVLERARIFGHHCHLACHYFNLGKLDESDLDEQLRPRLGGYKEFLFRSKFQPIASEEIVHSKRFGYAGMLDIRGRMKGDYALVDLKSGAVPRSVGPQTAGYQEACEERPRRRYCVQLLENDFKLIPCNDPSDWAMFQSCLNVWNFNNAKSRRSQDSRAA